MERQRLIAAVDVAEVQSRLEVVRPGRAAERFEHLIARVVAIGWRKSMTANSGIAGDVERGSAFVITIANTCTQRIERLDDLIAARHLKPQFVGASRSEYGEVRPSQHQIRALQPGTPAAGNRAAKRLDVFVQLVGGCKSNGQSVMWRRLMVDPCEELG